MSDAIDPLEAELTALRPRGPSDHLRRVIAEHQDAARQLRPRPRWRWRWRSRWGLAIAGGVAAAAACAAGVFMLQRGGHPDPSPGIAVVPVGPPAAAGVTDSSTTTLLAYGRALARSPEEFDARLDRDAVTSARGDAPAPLRACVWTHNSLRNLLGDD